jgi:hypothetical protein
LQQTVQIQRDHRFIFHDQYRCHTGVHVLLPRDAILPAVLRGCGAFVKHHCESDRGLGCRFGLFARECESHMSREEPVQFGGYAPD